MKNLEFVLLLCACALLREHTFEFTLIPNFENLIESNRFPAMELASICKISNSKYKLKWKPWENENTEFIEEEKECDVRMLENAAGNHKRKRFKRDVFAEDEIKLECKAWEDDLAALKVVFIGDQCIVTDQTVVVYGIGEKSANEFENDDCDEKESEDLQTESGQDEDSDYIPYDAVTSPATPEPAPGSAGDDERIQCPKCPAKLKSRQGLLSHDSKTHSLKPFKCTYCGKFYAEERYLKSHVREYHVSSKPFDCTRCGKSFTRPSRLAYHQKVVCIDESRFKCEVCGKLLKSEWSLRAHTVLHQDDRPFDCEHDGCGRSFKSLDNLRKHKLAHLDSSERG